MNHLTVENVSTIVHNRRLIDDISFTISSGEVVALVGHNGAGKSTLMKTIMKILPKEERGKISIQEIYDQDSDFLSFKRQLSFIPEEPMLLNELTVMQHFQLYGMSYEIKK